MNITPIVKERMRELPMTSAELARRSGYSPQYVCDLLAGRRRWNETSIDRVSKALGIRVRFELDDSSAHAG